MNSLNTSQETNSKSVGNAISTGADLGTKTGCFLSIVYSILGFLTILGIWDAFDSAYMFIGGALGLYVLILIPVLLLGAITGALLGWLSKKLSSVVPQKKFFLVGIFVCIFLLVILHVVFFAYYLSAINNNEAITEPLDALLTYLFLIGIPSVLYIAGGCWVSHRLALET